MNHGPAAPARDSVPAGSSPVFNAPPAVRVRGWPRTCRPAWPEQRAARLRSAQVLWAG